MRPLFYFHLLQPTHTAKQQGLLKVDDGLGTMRAGGASRQR